MKSTVYFGLFVLLVIVGCVALWSSRPSVSIGACTWCLIMVLHHNAPQPSILHVKVRPGAEDGDQLTGGFPFGPVGRPIAIQRSSSSTRVKFVITAVFGVLNGISYFSNFCNTGYANLEFKGNLAVHVLAWYEFPMWVYYFSAALWMMCSHRLGWKCFFSSAAENLHDGHRLAAAAYFFRKCATFSAIRLLQKVIFVEKASFSKRKGELLLAALIGFMALRQKMMSVRFLLDDHILNLPLLWEQHRLESSIIFNLPNAFFALVFVNQIVNMFDIHWMRIRERLEGIIEVEFYHSGLSTTWVQALAYYLRKIQPDPHSDVEVFMRLAATNAQDYLELYQRLTSCKERVANAWKQAEANIQEAERILENKKIQRLTREVERQDEALKRKTQRIQDLERSLLDNSQRILDLERLLDLQFPIDH